MGFNQVLIHAQGLAALTVGLLALMLRWDPALHVEGGQDQGIYVVMSAHLERTGGLDITSTVEELEPARRIVWTGAAGGIAAVQAWTFDVLDRGALVRTEESWEGESVAAAPDIMQAALDRSIRMWLEQLKRTAEARARRPDR